MKTITVNNLSEFKELLRMNDVAGDPWGVIMGAWFDCAAHLYEVGDCPVEWQYRPGWGGNVIDKESPYFDLFNEMDAEGLTEIGQYLWSLLTEFRDLFNELSKLDGLNPSQDQIIHLLKALGFKDMTRYTAN